MRPNPKYRSDTPRVATRPEPGAANTDATSGRMERMTESVKRTWGMTSVALQFKTPAVGTLLAHGSAQVAGTICVPGIIGKSYQDREPMLPKSRISTAPVKALLDNTLTK